METIKDEGRNLWKIMASRCVDYKKAESGKDSRRQRSRRALQRLRGLSVRRVSEQTSLYRGVKKNEKERMCY